METGIISLKLDADDVIKRIIKLKDEVESLRNRVKKANDDFKELGNSEFGGYDETREGLEKLKREISVNLDMIKALRKEVDGNMTAQATVADETTDSIRAMRGEVAQLTSVYKSLSKEQRESAAGQGLHESISLLKQQIKEAERFNIVRKEETGSIRKMKTELKELKKAYEGLSDVDRNGDVGTGLTNQIQQIENVFKRIKADAKMTFDLSGLDLSYAADDDTKSLANLTQRIEVLTAQNKVLMQSLRELNRDEVSNAATIELVSQAYEENRREITVLTAERRVLRREMENEMKLHKEEEGSLRALRAEVSRLTSQYDSMSKVRREGAEGTALLENIQKTTKELNMAEQASLRFQRNVGNYQSAFGNLNFQVQQLARELPSLSYGFNVFVGAISNNLPMLVDEVVRARREYAELMKTDPSKAVPVWKQLLSSVFSWQTALVAGITILTMYGREIGEWIESLFKGKKALSDIYETTEEFHKAVGGGSGSMLADLEKLSVEWEKLGDSLESKQKFIKDNAKEFEKLGVSITDVKDAENLFVKNKDVFVSSIIQRAKAAAIMDLAAEEYKKAVQKMMEADAMPEKKKVLKLGLDPSSGTMDSGSVEVDNSKNKADAKKEAENDFVEASKMVRRAAELSAEVDKILEAAGFKLVSPDKNKTNAATVRDMKAIELEEIRKAEDELLKTVKDARAREYKEMEFAYGRQIDDLKARLETEKDLSVEARKAINDQISALEQQRANKRIELSEEALQDQIKAKQTEIEKQLELIEEGTQAEFDIKRQALTDLEALDLKSAELTEAQKEEIRKRYAKKRADLESEQAAEINRRQAESMQARFDKELAELHSQESKKLQTIIEAGANEEQIEQAKLASEIQMIQMQHAQYLEELESMKRQEGETEEQYEARKAEVRAKADEAQMQATELKSQMMVESYKSIANGIEELGEVSESFAALSKVLALAEIAYNTGKALAAGIASASALPFPGNLAAIATTVGTILANIAQATKIVNSFSKGSKGSSSSSAKFATGGLVEGPGTATSDSIPAMLSNGESVLTAAATSMFAPVLSAFNQIGGGVPIQAAETANSVAGEEMLARAFMQGASALPAPVVSVVDINAGQKRVAQVESLASL